MRIESGLFDSGLSRPIEYLLGLSKGPLSLKLKHKIVKHQELLGERCVSCRRNDNTATRDSAETTDYMQY